MSGPDVLVPTCGVCGSKDARMSMYRIEHLRITRIQAACKHDNYGKIHGPAGTGNGQGVKPDANLELVDVPDNQLAAATLHRLSWPGGTAFGQGAGLVTQLDVSSFLRGEYKAVVVMQSGKEQPSGVDPGNSVEAPISTGRAFPMITVGQLKPLDVIVGPFDRLEADERGVVYTVSAATEREGAVMVNYATIRYRRDRDDAIFRARRQVGTRIAVESLKAGAR